MLLQLVLNRNTAHLDGSCSLFTPDRRLPYVLNATNVKWARSAFAFVVNAMDTSTISYAPMLKAVIYALAAPSLPVSHRVSTPFL